MLDPQEPKNGDFATYVENLARHPREQRLQELDHAGPARTHDKGDPAAWGRGADGAARDAAHNAAQDAAQDARQRAAKAVENALRKLRNAQHDAGPGAESAASAVRRFAGLVSTIMTVVGLVILVSGLLDDPPPFAHPFVGVALLVAARVVARIFKKR